VDAKSTLEHLNLPSHNLKSRRQAYLGPCWVLPIEFEMPTSREPNARKVWTALSSALHAAGSFFLAPCALFGDPAC